MRVFLYILSLLLLVPYLRLNAQELDSLIINKDSISVIMIKEKENIRITHFILPAVMITYGLLGLEIDGLKKLDLSTKDEIREDNPLFKSKIDNYTQFIPGAVVFALNGLGIQGKHNWKDAALIYGGSIAITTAIVTPLKNITKVERPDGSSKNSFPSGHTAIAFASAEFLRREYWNTSPWIGVAGYAMATSTGLFRMYNNRHWITDVVAGAGFGIASTTLSYLLYDKILKKNHLTFNITPTYYEGNIGLAYVQVF
ncbi:MAG: phosphatase PAP2 family protein [Candidatus Saccharimonadaceae bacterium]